jgi:hypothetical protein
MEGEFNFNADIERAISVEVQQITIKFEAATSTGRYSLIRGPNSRSTPYVATIDSSRPYFYFPEAICKDMAKVLGLTYDNETQHYLISSEIHEDLKSKNPVLEFQLASLSGQSKVSSPPSLVNITLPYSSLALNLSYPIMKSPGNSSLYFPIKVATSSPQNSLGRAFLQDVYLITNYERGTFSLNNVNWERLSSNSGDNIPIKADSSWVPSYLCQSQRKVPKRTIQIALAVIMPVLVITMITSWLLLRKRTQKIDKVKKEKEEADRAGRSTNEAELPNLSSTAPTEVEADGNRDVSNELQSESVVPEALGTPVFELYSLPNEMETNSNMLELQHQSSLQKYVPPQNEAVGQNRPRDSWKNEGPPSYRQTSESPITATPLEYYGRNARERLQPSARDIHTIGERAVSNG